MEHPRPRTPRRDSLSWSELGFVIIIALALFLVVQIAQHGTLQSKDNTINRLKMDLHQAEGQIDRLTRERDDLRGQLNR